MRSLCYGEKLQLILTVASLVARNINEATMECIVVSAFRGSLESGVRSFIGGFGTTLTPVAVKKFSHLV